jgi:hypothetical protein
MGHEMPLAIKKNHIVIGTEVRARAMINEMNQRVQLRLRSPRKEKSHLTKGKRRNMGYKSETGTSPKLQVAVQIRVILDRILLW